MRRVRSLLATVLAVTTMVTVGAVAQANGPERVVTQVGATAQPVPSPPGPSQSVDSTFRPIGPAGPCIVLDGGGTVQFGSGRLGGPAVTAPTTTTVRACQPGAPAFQTSASVSAATVAGVPTWNPTTCTTGPATCEPATNEFAYFLGATSLNRTLTTIDIANPLSHTLKLPPPGSAGGGSNVTMRVSILGVSP